jgi:hypothetical protein
MKKLITISLLFFVLACLGLGISCSNNNTNYTIKLSGTSGLSYFGHYAWQEAGSEYETKAMVSDKVPMQYTITGEKVSVYFAIGPGNIGKLKVEIIEGSRVIASSESSSADDVISIEIP